MKYNDVIGKIMSFGLPYMDKFIPGYKTSVLCAWSIAMAYCQVSGHYVFAPEVWAMTGFAGIATVGMKIDRMIKDLKGGFVSNQVS